MRPRRSVLLLALALGALLAGPGSAVGQKIPPAAKSWAGKSVVLTARPPAELTSHSNTKMGFGLLGVAAAAAQGKELIDRYGIEDPAPRIGQALLEAAQHRYHIVPAARGPVALASTDPARVARAGRGADLVFDVQPLARTLEPLLTQSERYFVTSELRFTVLEVPSARVLGDAHCVRTTQLDADLPSRAALLADRAARLKATLAAQRDYCLQFFKLTVLGLSSK